MPKDSDIQKEYDEAYDHAWAAYGDYQTEAKKDMQAYLGDIFTSKEKIKLNLRGSDLLNIQLIRPIIKWVAGFQADHRKGIKYEPIEGGDVETANDFTELGTAVIQRNKGYNIISRAFEHALKTGLCLVDVFNDLNDDTRLDHYFYNQFLLDPSWTKLDLSDCNFMMMRKFVNKDQARILLPEGFGPEISKIDDDKHQSDGKFPNLITPIQFGNKMFSYDQFQQRDTEQRTIVIIKQTGKEMEWKGSKKDLDVLLNGLVEQGIPAEMITTIQRTFPTVKVSAFLNGKHVETQIDPFKLGDYSATPIQCFYDPEYDQMKWKLQGMVRSLKDIQRAETKRMIAAIAWYENNISYGLDFEEGALVDDEDAFKTGGGPRMFTEGALSGDKARDRQTPPMPGGMLELHNMLTDLMPKTVNVNPDMMGLPPDANGAVISGLLSELRIGSGMVGLRGLFDDLSQSQNIIGSKLLKLYQRYPQKKVVRILGREPSEGFRDAKTAKFDAATAEGVLTDTQRNVQYQEMLNLMIKGQEMGKPFPAEWEDLLELGTLQISQTMLKKMKERTEQAQKKQQEQQQQQDKLQELTIQSIQASTAEDAAQAEERRSEVNANLAQAGLDQAKTITEIKAAEGEIGTRTVDQLIEIAKLNLEQQKLNQPIQNGVK